MKLGTTSDIEITEALPGVHRVSRRDRTVGYVQEAGAVYVALRGAVYNTSVEVGQALTLDEAVDRLVA